LVAEEEKEKERQGGHIFRDNETISDPLALLPALDEWHSKAESTVRALTNASPAGNPEERGGSIEISRMGATGVLPHYTEKYNTGKPHLVMQINPVSVRKTVKIYLRKL
jgi:hypothetical protein